MRMVTYPQLDEPRLAQLAGIESVEVANCGTEAEAIEALATAECFFGKITPAMLAAANKIRWIQSPTASLEHYLFPELIAHPCTLTNMRGLFSDVIADQVMGYILCFARNLHLYVRNQTIRRWAPEGSEAERVNFTTGPAFVSGIDRAHSFLADQTVGVVGLGAIGSEVARRARAFGMRVVGVDRDTQANREVVEQLWRPEDLNDLLAVCHYVVIAAPHTPETEGLFDADRFAAMRSDAYLINIGRGAIVSLDALVAALAQQQIRGAALDVYEIEPLPEDHPLWDFPNVILTPHVAGYSPKIAERHLELLLENTRRFASGQPLLNVVNKELWF
jgi:phosphoglycerate dehydrogenase-like enzyme